MKTWTVLGSLVVMLLCTSGAFATVYTDGDSWSMNTQGDYDWWGYDWYVAATLADASRPSSPLSSANQESYNVTYTDTAGGFWCTADMGGGASAEVVVSSGSDPGIANSSMSCYAHGCGFDNRVTVQASVNTSNLGTTTDSPPNDSYSNGLSRYLNAWASLYVEIGVSSYAYTDGPATTASSMAGGSGSGGLSSD